MEINFQTQGQVGRAAALALGFQLFTPCVSLGTHWYMATATEGDVHADLGPYIRLKKI
jgi:hypothetical protein